MNPSKVMEAAKNMDWEQVVQNGGPPCFFLQKGKFCGRAQRWAGHTDKEEWPDHRFVSLDSLLATLQAHAQALAEALDRLYSETVEYITINHLGDPHHNQSMKDARSALAEARKSGVVK